MQFGLQDLSGAVAVLTAMITPAVLISACGTLILSTSTRLGRTVDRVRKLLEQLEELTNSEEKITLYEERREFLYHQVEQTARRNRLLQRAIAIFYGALNMFIATSVSIGLVAVTGRGYEWLPAALGLTGASFLFYGSVLLIFETRIAHDAIFAEMDFTLRLSRNFVPQAFLVKDAENARNRRLRFLRFGRGKNTAEKAEKSETTK